MTEREREKQLKNIAELKKRVMNDLMWYFVKSGVQESRSSYLAGSDDRQSRAGVQTNAN